MASEDVARRKAMAAVNSIFERYHLINRTQIRKEPVYDIGVMNDLKLLDAGPEGSTLYELHVDEKYANLNNIMHGGATATIFDMATMSALGPLSRPGYWFFMGGISRSLNVSFLRAVPTGTTVRIRSWVVQIGKTMAMIRGEMFSGGDGNGGDGADYPKKTIYAVAEHHKVHLPTLPEHAAFRVNWDDEIEAEVRKEVGPKTEAKAKM